jgi:cyanophycin synthetase
MDNFYRLLQQKTNGKTSGSHEYLMALEAFRRGLTVYVTRDPSEHRRHMPNKLLKNRVLTKFSSEFDTHYFCRARGDWATNEAYEICMDKSRTKLLLGKAGVKTPKGELIFKSISRSELELKVAGLNFPIVLKPVDGSFGEGVVTNINNLEELFTEIKAITGRYEKSQFIIEEQVHGLEVRTFASDEKTLAATIRRPPSVICDGKKSILELIEEKNGIRLKNPHLRSRPILIDKDLERTIRSKGYEINDIPAKGTKLELRTTLNFSVGGESVNLSADEAREKYHIASEAVRAIPGLFFGGVDLIIDSHGSPVVIEVNATPGFGMHVYPLEGDSVNVMSEVFDRYFPSSSKRPKHGCYFDWKLVRKELKKGKRNVKIEPLEGSDLFIIKFSCFVINPRKKIKSLHFDHSLVRGFYRYSLMRLSGKLIGKQSEISELLGKIRKSGFYRVRATSVEPLSNISPYRLKSISTYELKKVSLPRGLLNSFRAIVRKLFG